MTCLRQATARDADVEALWTHCKALHQHHNGNTRFELTKESLRLSLACGLIHAILAQQPACGAFVGSAIFSYTFSTWTGKKNIYLEHLYVAPGHRGAGYGRALVDSLLLQAEGRIELSVQASNVETIAFYKKCGAEVHENWIEMRVEAETKQPTPEAA